MPLFVWTGEVTHLFCNKKDVLCVKKYPADNLQLRTTAVLWITNNHLMFGKSPTTTLSGAWNLINVRDHSNLYHEMGWGTSNYVKYTLYHKHITGHHISNL